MLYVEEAKQVKFKAIKDYDGFFWLLNHNYDMAFDGAYWRQINPETFPRTIAVIGDLTINEFINLLGSL